MALATILLAGCASPYKYPPMDISSFSLFATYGFEQEISKACYHPESNTVFAMVPSSHQIAILKDGKSFNVIGGMGLAAQNFQALGDISLGQDGSLYALDISEKSIKKFNGDGKLSGSLKLSSSIQPTKIAVGQEQNIYVWDSSASEIIAYNLLDGSELYRFGKFQVQSVSELFANRDYLVAFDEAKETSEVFSSLGQYLSSEKGQVVYDAYNNGISLSADGLISLMSAAFMPVTEKYDAMTMVKDILVVVAGTQVHLLKVDYEQVR